MTGLKKSFDLLIAAFKEYRQGASSRNVLFEDENMGEVENENNDDEHIVTTALDDDPGEEAHAESEGG